jgi:anti-sigma factor RsiW
MSGAEELELLHAEIDGELDEHQRARLSRALLADPALRARREELRRLAEALDWIPDAEPPAGLVEAVIAALPQSQRRAVLHSGASSTWRQVAMIAALLAAGAVIYAVVDSRAPPMNEVAGTLTGARPPAVLDSARVADGPVHGRVLLTRGDAGIALELDVSATTPVEVLVMRAGEMLRTVEVSGRRASPLVVSLPGVAADGMPVEVRFRVAGREVSRTSLRAPVGP